MTAAPSRRAGGQHSILGRLGARAYPGAILSRETSAPLNLLFNATSVLRAPPFRGALTSCIMHVRGFSHRPSPSFSYDHKIGQLVELAKNLTLYFRDVECAIAITAMNERKLYRTRVRTGTAYSAASGSPSLGAGPEARDATSSSSSESSTRCRGRPRAVGDALGTPHRNLGRVTRGPKPVGRGWG